jgi:DNA-directed RNA polymerase subunit N (RpoN/RPB10)
MLYLKCPTCGTLLGNKQSLYEDKISEINKQIEMDKLSLEDALVKKEEVLNSLQLLNICCRTRAMTYKRIVEIVK